MAEPTPRGEGLVPLDKRFRKIEKRLDELARPSGTQRFTSVDQLQRAIEVLQETVATLSTVVDEQAAQIAFLQTQTVGAQNVSVSTAHPTTAETVNMPWDDDYDLELVVTTGESGKLTITVSGVVGVMDQIASGFLGFTIVGWGGSPFVTSTWLSGSGAAGDVVVATLSRTSTVDLAPNTTYTIRTARSYESYGPGTVSWSSPTLSVTRSA